MLIEKMEETANNNEDPEKESSDSVSFPWMVLLGVIVTFFSIILYIADTILDIIVAYDYYDRGYHTYFCFTAMFILIPAGVVTVFSCVFYLIDRNNPEIPPPSKRQIIMRVIFTVLVQCPLLRDFNVLLYGCKFIRNPKEDRYYKKMEKEDSDSASLRLFERFLEAAPQVTLQLFVIIHHYRDKTAHFDGTWQRLSAFFSLVSLANALTSYNHTSRTVRDVKMNMSIIGRVWQFCWHFCIISSRVIALAVFASAYPQIMMACCAVHWLFMLVWLYMQRSSARKGSSLNEIDDPEFYQRILAIMHTFYVRIYKLFLNIIFAFVYVFVFFNTRDEPTRHLYWIFYVICLVQNSFFTFFSLDLQGPPVIIWISLVSYFLFILGIFFMITYYKWFHPSMKFPTVIDALKHSMSLGQPKTYVQPPISNGSVGTLNNV